MKNKFLFRVVASVTAVLSVFAVRNFEVCSMNPQEPGTYAATLTWTRPTLTSQESRAANAVATAFQLDEEVAKLEEELKRTEGKEERAKVEAELREAKVKAMAAQTIAIKETEELGIYV